MHRSGIFLSNFQGGGAFEIVDLFLTNFGSFEKNCGPLTMPQGSEVQVS